ncbi:hypothetical protein AVEN_263257-1, partial [Araneus ventricosus]
VDSDSDKEVAGMYCDHQLNRLQEKYILLPIPQQLLTKRSGI